MCSQDGLMETPKSRRFYEERGSVFRKIVGWQADDRMTKELVIQALEKAYWRQKPIRPVLHHSERGSQYASHEYRARRKSYGMQGSMRRKGNCYDNACIESFHSTIKRELVHLKKFETREEAKKRMFEYIESWYNGERIQSSIEYMAPVEFERKCIQLIRN